MTLSIINISSLNARSVLKSNHPQTQKEYSRFLHSQIHPQTDVLCLQELTGSSRHNHLSPSDIQTLQFLFPNTCCLISKYTAIICLNPKLTIIDQSISLDERITAGTIVSTDDNQQLCYITNIYAPANRDHRIPFYNNILNNPQVIAPSLPNKHILLGDFNIHIYDHRHYTYCDHQPWIQHLLTNFMDTFATNANDSGRMYKPMSTFKRGPTRSTVDYIFASPDIKGDLIKTLLAYLPSEWTDHHLLTMSLHVSESTQMGPGTWRFNPQFLDDTEFQSILSDTLHNLVNNIDLQTINRQLLWDKIKLKVKICTILYSSEKNKKYKSSIEHLQEARQNAVSNEELLKIEHQLDDLYKVKTQQLIIRSNTIWSDKGERNNKYFFNTLKARTKRMTLTAIQNPVSNVIHTDIGNIIKETRSYYKDLYNTEDVDIAAINVLTSNISDHNKLSSQDQNLLTADILQEDIINIIKHSPIHKSPGLDGLGFEFYKLILSMHPKLLELLTLIMNDALNGLQPTTWRETKMVLLYKKGDRTLLQNWRPLSLINCDAKLFTKMVANRLNCCLPKIINPYQTGFMPHRLISDNGWITQTLMQHTVNTNPEDTSIGLLLDQEKAYDRIHPLYLQKVLECFHFPSSLINSLVDLFFNTKISLSINGWLAAPIYQKRGLRQGDPISPLLFNIAFEPLLRIILSENSINGVPILDQKIEIIENKQYPVTIKLLAYADDLMVFIRDLKEWYYLKGILKLYSEASNAKVNFQKTVMFSITGASHIVWKEIAKADQISWHDKQNPTAITYLGYPVYSSKEQLNTFLWSVENKLANHINILRQRSLSIRGRAIVANSLILSRLWHILRVTIVPEKWLSSIRRKVYEYVVPFFPKPSYHFLCSPKNQGGINLIDINHQFKALHMVYINKMITPNDTNFLYDIFQQFINYYTKQPSVIPVLIDPQYFNKKFKKLPQMKHMIKMLSFLPPLEITSNWPLTAVKYLPLRRVLVLNELPRISKPILDIKRLIPANWFAKDLMETPPSNSRSRIKYDAILSSLFLDQLKIHPYLKNRFFQRNKVIFNNSESSIFQEWKFSLSSSSNPLIMHKAPPSSLRRYWFSQGSPIYPVKHPPLSQIPGALMSKTDWTNFWQLNIPHKAIEIWWRILIHKLPTNCRLHQMIPTKFQTPRCFFCPDFEDDQHFILHCKKKKEFWKAFLHSKNIPQERFKNIWPSITFNCTNKVNDNTLVLIGHILLILWQQHWHHFFEGTTWRTDFALASWKVFQYYNNINLD